MDIRTKLVFALVIVALGSMVALGGLLYLDTSQVFEDSRVEELSGLAASTEAGMRQIASSWEDRVRLIASRTRLREILTENNLEGSPGAKEQIGRILADAQKAVGAVESVAVYDAEGNLFASAGWATQSDLTERLDSLPSAMDSVVYLGVLSPAHEELRVAYSAALTDDGTTDGRLVGVLQVRLNTRPLIRLARNREGLGLSGQTRIAIRDEDGAIRVLTRVTPTDSLVWEEVGLGGPSDPLSYAMGETVGPPEIDLVGADGERVWAAYRHLPTLDWGVVVQIDEAEARAPADKFGFGITDIIMALGALAILIGTFLGLRFAKPIHELADAAERIKEGDLSVRAPVRSQDEVGLLARNFNQMAEEMEQQVSLLKEFQNYFELSTDMLCIAGQDGFFKRVNPAFEQVLGWTQEELLSRSFLDFVHPDDLEKTENEIARLGEGLPTISFENRYMCQDGSEKRLAWNAHPQVGTGLIYAIARDVTDLVQERKKAQDRIEYLKDRLEKAEANLRGDP
ncbi:MAG: PAS domain S-box protein [Gemmatimonadetes bacterium]|nr:PAS domain S-box protein [Gemmatimonadota bacterium]NNM05213.1 PAS domain S-box protein [Gemmatimonadota bacterium]